MTSVLIIGGYGGIGRALTRLLTDKGRSIVIAGRNLDTAEQLASEYKQKAIALDARDEVSWQKAMDDLDSADVKLDGVVNLCGSILVKPITSTSSSDFKEAWEQNVLTAYHSIKFCGPRLAQNAGGSIVLMSSVAAQFGLPNHEIIAAAKAAVEGLTVSAAASYAGKNVRINAVAPGLVATPLSQRFVSTEEAKKASAAMHPLGRIGEPIDIASVIALLLDADASWITGQVIAVDGGMSRVKSRR